MKIPGKIGKAKSPRLKDPYLIVGWPGMGEVAFKAVSFLVEKLKAEELAELAPEKFFYHTAGVIEKGIIEIAGLPVNKFFFWKDKKNKHDLIFFLSNSQPELSKAKNYSQAILEMARVYKVEKIYGFASLPRAIEHTKLPEVLCAATHKEEINDLRKYGFRILTQGQISGMNGVFVSLAKEKGLRSIVLLAEIPLYTIHIENPKAVLEVLKSFKNLINIDLDLADLKAQADMVAAEIDRMMSYIRTGTESSGPISETDVEAIRGILSRPSSLPSSVGAKIEKLFELAKKDINRAGELKHELDKWSIYKDYEDRFLDLFKRHGEIKDN